jgi:heme-degrading monooxygenase HmoA
MFTVVFEVHPAPGKKDEYLGLAKHLRPILESIDGFIDNERFESKRREGWVLSLSTWRDEKAVVRWRSQGEHHRIQERGRNGIFSDYHLRVCEVTADSHPPKNLQVIEQRLDVSEIGKAKALAITEVSPAPGATFPTHPDVLPSHVGFDVEARWTPKSFAGVVELCHRRVRNVRDYGMFERREAAQYFPEVEKATQE